MKNNKDIDSLSHTTWRCQYHVVFAPKYRRMVIYGQIKKDIGQINRCAFIYEKVFYADVQTLANTFQRVQGWILNAALNMPNVCGIHVTT